MALMAGGEEFFECYPFSVLTNLQDVGMSLINLLLASALLGNKPGNATAVPGNNEFFTPLYFVQKLRQMGFCLGGLYFAHNFDQSI